MEEGAALYILILLRPDPKLHLGLLYRWSWRVILYGLGNLTVLEEGQERGQLTGGMAWLESNEK